MSEPLVETSEGEDSAAWDELRVPEIAKAWSDLNASVLRLDSGGPEVQQKFLDAVRLLASRASDRFARMICEGILEKGDDGGEPNPFSPAARAHGLDRNSAESLCEQYSDIASLILAGSDRRRSRSSDDEEDEDRDEFVSLKEWILNGSSGALVLPAKHFNEPTIRAVIHDYFEAHEGLLQMGILGMCERIFQGVPLYQRLPERDEPVRVPFSDPDYIYLAKKGEFFDSGETGFPEWAERYLVRCSDVEEHDELFAGVNCPGPEAAAALRHELWRMIGVSESEHEPRNPPLTVPRRPQNAQRLFDIADAALKQFNEDGTFGKDRQRSIEKAVKKWLKEEHGCNTAEQAAIYVMVRP